MKLADVRKFIGAAAGAAGVLAADGLLDGTAERWTTGVIAAATAALVYLVPNGSSKDPAGDPDAADAALNA